MKDRIREIILDWVVSLDDWSRGFDEGYQIDQEDVTRLVDKLAEILDTAG